jgi:hypothetical protein
MKYGNLHGYRYPLHPETVGHKMTDEEIDRILERIKHENNSDDSFITGIGNRGTVFDL